MFPAVCDVYAMEFKDGVRTLGSRNSTMARIASAIGGPARLGRTMVDRTGLTGTFDFAIAWTPEPDVPGTTFLEALREQLGLKVESTRGPIQILVIDHVESPSEN